MQRRFAAAVVALGVVAFSAGIIIKSTGSEPGGAARGAAWNPARATPRPGPAAETAEPELGPGEPRVPLETSSIQTTPTRAVPVTAPPTPRPTAPPAPVVAGRTVYVSAAAGQKPDGSPARPFRSIAEGLQAAQPGDTVSVGPGSYQGFVTARAGHEGAPIRIVGSAAVIKGKGSGHLVEVQHSHVTLEGFEITRADILVWVVHTSGVRIANNVLRDARGECIRVKYQATDNEITGNRIEGCGRDFDADDGEKNGEGVYIGTSPEQLKRNPGPEPDRSDRNWVHDNVMNTPAECVDIKEASSGNVVEGNLCTGGRDPDGAGFSARGNGNVFRANTSSGHKGAGIRLGGDDEGDGIDNVVVGNRLIGNEGYGVKIRRNPQRQICGNELSGNGDDTTDGGPDPAKPC